MRDRPNVIVVMTDQQRATASHLYGGPCETPAMARLADRGVLFDNAISPHPLCMPARISFWTSQFPHTHGGRRNETPMPPDATHAFRLWKAAGYTTGLIGKNHCFDDDEDLRLFDVWNTVAHGGGNPEAPTWGMDWFRSIEARSRLPALVKGMRPQNPRFSYATSKLPLEDYTTGLVAGQTVRFLEKHRSEPFALWVSLPDPHEPWMAPAQYADLFPPDKIELPRWREGEFEDERAPERNRVLYRMLGMEEDSLADIHAVMACYFGMTRFADDGLGQILDAVECLGLREETIVVFCSDHGDFMGEHRMQCKGGVFYDSLTRVPLIVSWPGKVPSGARDASMVNLIDVVPTLLQLQGLETPRCMQGEALPTATAAPAREETFSEYGCGGPLFRHADLERLPRPWGRDTLIKSLQWREAEGRRKMVRTSEWKYVHDSMGDLDELYDLVNDPGELENVAAEERCRDAVNDMRLRLANWSIDTEGGPPVPLPKADRYALP